MRYVFYFLLLAATLNAQSDYNRHSVQSNSGSVPQMQNSSGVIPGQIRKAHDDVPLSYAPQVTYAYNSQGEGSLRKDSTRYNTEGMLYFKLVQFDDMGVWVNSLKDTAYVEPSAGGETYLYISLKWKDSLWVNNRTDTTEYDNEGNILLYIKTTYSSPDPSVYKVTYDYTGGLLTQSVAYLGTQATLKPSNRNSYSYNPAGMITEYFLERWQGGMWTNISIDSSFYDGNELLAQFSHYTWTSGSWKHSDKTGYAYDSSGVLISDTVWINSNNVLTYLSQTNYMYDTSGNAVNLTTYSWSTMDSAWRYSTKEDMEYDEMGLLTSYERYYWNPMDSSWTPQYGNTYVYDENGNLLTAVDEYPLSSGMDEKIEYTYDENNNRITGSAFIGGPDWVSNNATLSNQFESYFGYHISTEYEHFIPIAVNKEDYNPVRFTLNQNYPNPFNPETKISFSLPQSGKASLKIYDMLGREVMELVSGDMSAGKHEVSFNGKNLSSGVYIYRLQSGSFTESKKMLLLK